MNNSIVLLPAEFDDHLANQIRSITSDHAIHTSKDAYNALFARLGSWGAWINHIALGKDYLSQKPLYAKFYCVTPSLGRANADIVRKALELGKDCQYFDGKDFYSIIGVSQVSDDWTSGWEISFI